jgi:RNA polymerase sigma factor (sigma-70 family)
MSGHGQNFMSDFPEPPELDLPNLVKRAVEGDGGARERLQRIIDPAIAAAVRKALKGEYRSDFDEVFQAARTRVLEVLPIWRGTGLFAFVQTISRFLAINAVRHHLVEKKVRSYGDLEAVDDVAVVSHSPYEALEQREMFDRIKRVVEQIQDKQLREVLELRLNDATFGLIGRQMGKSESWARLAWQQVLDQLLRAWIDESAKSRLAKP